VRATGEYPPWVAAALPGAREDRAFLADKRRENRVSSDDQLIPVAGACMADLDAVLEQLKQERKRTEGELRQLDKVIAVLVEMAGMTGTPSRYAKPGGHRLSAAARERIAAAQRKRWAKVREKSTKQ
jgi:hypothetical protein